MLFILLASCEFVCMWWAYRCSQRAAAAACVCGVGGRAGQRGTLAHGPGRARRLHACMRVGIHQSLCQRPEALFVDCSKVGDLAIAPMTYSAAHIRTRTNAASSGSKRSGHSSASSTRSLAPIPRPTLAGGALRCQAASMSPWRTSGALNCGDGDGGGGGGCSVSRHRWRLLAERYSESHRAYHSLMYIVAAAATTACCPAGTCGPCSNRRLLSRCQCRQLLHG